MHLSTWVLSAAVHGLGVVALGFATLHLSGAGPARLDIVTLDKQVERPDEPDEPPAFELPVVPELCEDIEPDEVERAPLDDAAFCPEVPAPVAFLSERGRLAQRLSRPLRPVRRTVNVIIGRAGAGAAPAPGKPKPSGVTRGPALRAGSGGGLGYPEAARKQGLEGVVVLLLSIDATGHVDRVEISESSGHTLLDEAAVQAARTWRFDPAMKNGQPVPGSLVRRVRFRLR